jgi:hypothetical protein
MKKDQTMNVVARDDERYAIAYGDIIHIEDSDDEVQYMGATTALTSTHHMQQQQHAEHIGDHFAGQQTHQQQPHSHEYVSKPSPISHPLRGAMSAYPDDPLTTSFRKSNVVFQDNRNKHTPLPTLNKTYFGPALNLLWKANL